VYTAEPSSPDADRLKLAQVVGLQELGARDPRLPAVDSRWTITSRCVTMARVRPGLKGSTEYSPSEISVTAKSYLSRTRYRLRAQARILIRSRSLALRPAARRCRHVRPSIRWIRLPIAPAVTTVTVKGCHYSFSMQLSFSASRIPALRLRPKPV